MKVTYNWLKQYTDIHASPEALVEQLTMLGLEVDSLLHDSVDFSGVFVGEVLKRERHPDADKLSVCEVSIGTKALRVVCGAPNVAAGQKVAVATPGARLPGGTQVKMTKIRGVESEGMICSDAELGIGGRSDGILVLDASVEIGRPFQELLEENDHIIDIDVTPNRPDCFGVIGIARDLATVTGSTLNLPKLTDSANGKPTSELIRVNIHDPDKCPRYTARYIGSVAVGPSPLWLARRLEQVGIRSINNVVDITNYVMMETGQPLHAFDYDLLAGHEINVRCAQDGEEFTTLDDKKHTLNAECLLICDAEKAVALGGIMGGQNSEVCEKTRNILLESAYFDPVNIRRSSKKLAISTESSKRFERGVDPNGAQFALNRAAELIAQLGNGELASGFVDAYPKRIDPTVIRLRPARVELLLGVNVPLIDITAILQGLGCQVAGDEKVLEVTAPTFRPDLTREADLIEEIGRIYGYDKIPEEFNALVDQSCTGDTVERLTTNAKNTLIALGFSEAVTFNLISWKHAGAFVTHGQPIKLVNPLSEDLSTLRTSLLPSLLLTLRWNINRHNKDLRVFELGTIHCLDEGVVKEEARLTGLMTGKLAADTWKVKAPGVDFYDLKGAMEQFLQRNHVQEYGFSKSKTAFSTENVLTITAGARKIGDFGEISPDVREAFDVEQPVYFFDFVFENLLASFARTKPFSPIPKFPPVTRDLAIVLNEDVAAAQVIESVRQDGGELLRNVHIFDVFKNAQIGEDKKSLALSLSFYSLERTLTEHEVDKQIEKILKGLQQRFSARLRS